MTERPTDLPGFDGRPTIRLANSMPEHPKIIGLSDAAFRLWIEAICFCSRQETDGQIPKPMMRRLGQAKVIKELMSVGLLDEMTDRFDVHDYLRHQRSAAEIRSFRESKAERGTKGAHMRWHVPRRQRVKDCPYCLTEVDSA